MTHVNDTECGLCVHFGEQHPGDAQLVEIRQTHEAPDDFVDECGHPRMEPMHLLVTANSHCDGFEPATS